jgi:hypothetical protein
MWWLYFLLKIALNAPRLPFYTLQTITNIPSPTRPPPHTHTQVTGTKAELMLRVLGAFKLAAPTTAPAALLRALLLERGLADDQYPTAAVSFVWDGEGAAGVAQEVKTLIRLMEKLLQAGDARARELAAAQVCS